MKENKNLSCTSFLPIKGITNALNRGCFFLAIKFPQKKPFLRSESKFEFQILEVQKSVVL